MDMKDKAPEAMILKTPTADKKHTNNDPASELPAKKAERSDSPVRASLRRFRRDIRAMVSLCVLVLMILIAIVGPPIYQHIGANYPADLGGTVGPALYHSYGHQELSQQNQGPSARYWLGTDALGRDMLARSMQGLLVSLIVALLVELVDIGFGMTIGVLAGYFGGWVDTFLARITDLTLAFPSLLLAVLLTGIFNTTVSDSFANLPLIGPFLSNGNGSLVIVSLALALVSWPLMARYVRGQALQLKEQQFIEAAHASGTRNITIIIRHIIPNLFNFVVLASTLNMVGTIIGESALSFLGLGVRSPGSSIGLMIADGLDSLEIHPWNTLYPTLVLTIVVLAISFIADGLRDAFDVRLGN